MQVSAGAATCVEEGVGWGISAFHDLVEEVDVGGAYDVGEGVVQLRDGFIWVYSDLKLSTGLATAARMD